jgi:hypothetical protein
MAVDILSLGFKVDTKEVVRGNRELDNLRNSATGASGATDKLSSSFLGMSKSLASSLISIGAVITIYKKAITESQNFAREQGQLEAVIKSTGMAAGFSALQLNKMADSFAKSTTFTVGEITKAQTRLLSYSGIVGDTFPEAMQITIDMAARMGMSIEQSAETIGRALDIPSQGLSALSRQGFRFTESQKALVEQFEATGRVAEAQKIIIDSVTASYGGAAEALNTGLNKATADASKAFQDLFTALGNTSLVQNTTITAFSALTNVLKEIQRIIEQDLNRVIYAVTASINALAVVLSIKLAPSLATTTVAFVSATQQSIAYQLALARMAGVTTTAAIATGALSVATKALLGPIGLIATALGVATLAWHNYGEEAKNATDKTAQSIESAKGKVEQLKKQLEDLSNVNPLQDELNQAAKNYADTIASSIEVININGDAVKTNTEQVRKAKKQLEEIVDLYHQAQSIIDERTNKLKDETKATDDVVVSLKSLEEAEKAYQRVLENRKSATIEIADLRKVTALLKEGLNIEEARFRVESKRKGLLPAQIEALIKEKNIQDEIVKQAEDLIKAKEKAHQDEIERIKQITQLQQTQANENFRQAQNVQREIENANQRMAESLNRSLTDALLRGFESGLSFAENFRRTLRNMFATLVLQPVISFILQPVTSAATNIMSGITSGAGTAGGMGSLSSTLGGIGNLFTSSNEAILRGIEGVGTAISTGMGGIRDTIGGFIGQNSAFIAKALPFLDAGVKLLSGDIRGAAFSGAGAAIGLAIGGPIGGAIGSFLGSSVGGLFGGKKQPPRTVTQLPDVAEAFNESLSALLQGFGRTGDVTSTASFTGRAGGSGYGGFSAMVEDMAINDIIRYKDAFNDESLQAFITRTLTETLTRAIKSTDIDKAFKDLFEGITKREDMGLTIQAVVQLNKNNQQLTDTLGITATQVALLARESNIAGDNLALLVNTLTGVANELFTTGDALVAIKAGIDSAFSTITNSELPANLKAFDDALRAIDTTTAAGRKDFLGLIELRGTFAEFENAMAGLRGNVRGALFTIVDDAERISMMNEDLIKLFTDLNLKVPTTVQELINLGNSIDLTTAAGINLANAFPTLVSAFNQTQQAIADAVSEANRNVEIARNNLISSFEAERSRLQGVIDDVANLKDALRQAFDTRASGLQDTINRFKTFGNSIRDFRKALGQTLAANADPLSSARDLFNQTVAAALKGDTEALQNIQKVSTDYLETTKEYASDFVDYQKAFAFVSNTLLKVENSAFSTASVAELQLQALKTQVGSLISLDNNIKTVEQAMVELVQAQDLARQAELELAQLNNQQITLLGDINNSVLSVAAAIAQFNIAVQAQSSAQAKLKEAQTAPSQTLTPESIYTQFLGRAPDPEGLAYWQREFGSTVDKDELRTFQNAVKENVALGFETSEEAKNFAAMKFATGGVFTNGIVSRPTMFNTAMMGEAGSEAIMPLTNINGKLGVSTNNSEMVVQLKVISEKISRLEAAQIATVQNTGKVAKIIERADNGDSINVTVTT